jgi:hypothetical protein
MSEIADAPHTLAMCRDYDSIVSALRARQDQLGLSNHLLDELSGFADGHTDKLLGPSRIKSLGAFTLRTLMDTLAVSFVMIEDMDKVRRMESRWEKRQECYVVKLSNRRRVSQKLAEELRPAVAKEMGRIGGQKRAAVLSPKLRQDIARKAGKASAKARRAKRLATRSSAAAARAA